MKTTKQTITNQVESEFGSENLRFSGNSVFEDGVFKSLRLDVTERQYFENASPEGEAVESHVHTGEIVFEYRDSGAHPLNAVAVDMFIGYLNELKNEFTNLQED